MLATWVATAPSRCSMMPSRPASKKPRGPLSTTRTASIVMKPFPSSGERHCRGLSAVWIARRSVSIRGWAVRERPILFSGEMVRAILEGRKTVTRRVVPGWQLPTETKGPHDEFPQFRFMSVVQRDPRYGFGVFGATEDECMAKHSGGPSPYGRPGDRLWVREAHAFVPEPSYRRSTGVYQKINPEDSYQACVYRENFDRARSFPWRPSIHMPRWASRIQLEITSVRVERLQEISEEQARAEGGRPLTVKLKKLATRAYRMGFIDLWCRINGDESWDANPWVWVVEFKVIKGEQHG